MKLFSVYSDFLESNAKERKSWTASDKATLAEPMTKIKEVSRPFTMAI